MIKHADIKTVKIDGRPMTFGEYYANVEAYVMVHELTAYEDDDTLPARYVQEMWLEELPVEVACYQIAQGC